MVLEYILSPNILGSTKDMSKEAIKKSMKLTMDETNLASYFDIKDQLRPFDLVAFRGGDVISNLISKMEEHEVGVGAFSHVGMIVTSDILPIASSGGKSVTLKPGHPYLFESTFTYNIAGLSDGVPDIVSGKGDFGVQLRDLEEVIPRYITDENTKIAWCRLKNNPFNEIPGEEQKNLRLRRELLRDMFTDFFRRYEDRLYEMDFESLLAAMFPSLRFIRDIRDTIFSALYSVLYSCGLADKTSGPAGWQFCSELVANVYKEIGIIAPNFDPKNVVPIDFFGCDVDSLPALVEAPVYLKDWDLPDKPAVHYDVENIETHYITTLK